MDSNKDSNLFGKTVTPHWLYLTAMSDQVTV